MSGIPEATPGILTMEERADLDRLARSRRTEHRLRQAGSDRAFGCERHSESGDWTRSWMHDRYGLEVAGPLCREAACGSQRNGRSGRRAEVCGGDEQTHPDADGSSAVQGLCPLDGAIAGCCAGRCRCPVYLALPTCAEDRPCRAKILALQLRSLFEMRFLCCGLMSAPPERPC